MLDTLLCNKHCWHHSVAKHSGLLITHRVTQHWWEWQTYEQPKSRLSNAHNNVYISITKTKHRIYAAVNYTNELFVCTTHSLHLVTWFMTMNTESVQARKQRMSMVGMNPQLNILEHTIVLLTYTLHNCTQVTHIHTDSLYHPILTLICLHLWPSVLWHCWLGGTKGMQKNWVVGCWRGYLSGARCRLAYGPADATATHCLLLQ